MIYKQFGMVAIVVSLGMGVPQLAWAQEQVIDCEDDANSDDPTCLGLPETGEDITNFVPIIAPLLGAAALAGLAGGGGSTTTTTSTTSTTGTGD